MPDYTIEVLVEEEVDYDFVVEDIQPFIRAKRHEADFWDCPEDYESLDECTYLDPHYDEWHFTEVSIYDPPDVEQFWHEMGARYDDNRSVRVVDSSGSVLVEDGPYEVGYCKAIGDVPIEEGLFHLLFNDLPSSLPDGTTYYDDGGLYSRLVPENTFERIRGTL